MAVERSYARLGLFLVVALVVVLATALLFIQRLRSRAVIEMVTYTTENVSGLDVSSPVRYRGVPVGRVTERARGPARRAPSRSTSRCSSTASTPLARTSSGSGRLPISGACSRKLRAQVVGNPVTGEAYLLLDAPENPPPPLALGFTPNRAYIPSMPTPLSAMRDRLPEVLERAEATLQALGRSSPGFPTASTGATDSSPTSSASFSESELPALSADSRKFFATTSAQIEQIDVPSWKG